MGGRTRVPVRLAALAFVALGQRTPVSGFIGLRTYLFKG